MTATAQTILTFATGPVSHEFVEQGHSKGKHSVFRTEDHPFIDQTVTDRTNMIAGRFKVEAASNENWQAAAWLRSTRRMF